LKKKIFYFFVSYLISLILALNFQIIPPLISFIIESWDITRAQAGLLMGITALPPMIFGLPSGYFLDKFGNKIPIIVSLLFYLLGEALLLLANNFIFLLLSRIVIGFGAVILGIVGLRILAEEFQGDNLGKVVGFWSTGMPVAVMISFNIFPLIASRYSWKTPAIILLILTILLFFLITLFYREEQKEKNDNIGFLLSIKDVSKNVWILGIVWFLFNAGSLSFSTFAPDYFISRGFSPIYASSISSLYMLGAFLSPLIGQLLDRTSKPNLMIFTGTFLLSMSLMLIYLFNLPIVVVIAGIFSSIIPPSVFYLLPKLTDKFGLGYSILSVFVNLGTVFAPSLIGYAKDLSGNYFISFLFMSIFLLLSGVLGLNLKLKETGY
jgi:MFS family permease